MQTQPPEQVKYFTDTGEEIVPLDPPAELIPMQSAMYENESPWPAIILVLGSFVLFVLCVLGSVWILHT